MGRKVHKVVRRIPVVSQIVIVLADGGVIERAEIDGRHTLEAFEEEPEVHIQVCPEHAAARLGGKEAAVHRLGIRVGRKRAGHRVDRRARLVIIEAAVALAQAERDGEGHGRNAAPRIERGAVAPADAQQALEIGAGFEPVADLGRHAQDHVELGVTAVRPDFVEVSLIKSGEGEIVFNPGRTARDGHPEPGHRLDVAEDQRTVIDIRRHLVVHIPFRKSSDIRIAVEFAVAGSLTGLVIETRIGYAVRPLRHLVNDTDTGLDISIDPHRGIIVSLPGTDIHGALGGERYQAVLVMYVRDELDGFNLDGLQPELRKRHGDTVHKDGLPRQAFGRRRDRTA